MNTRRIAPLLGLLLIGIAALVLTGCDSTAASGPLPTPTFTPAPPPPTNTPTDDLTALNDEFNDPATLANWQNLAPLEGWPDPAETLDISQTNPGHLTIIPYTCTWFEDYHGVYLFKTVSGPFDVQTRVQATGKDGGLPQRTFSFSGLMARAARTVTPATWQPGGENWVFITTGYGDNDPRRAGKPQLETKTTTNSHSSLILTVGQTGWVDLRVVRLGDWMVMLYRFADGPWKVSQRYQRSDLPATLQVGINVYTNWESIGPDPFTMNSVLQTQSLFPPDLISQNDYIHFHRPPTPTGDLSALSNADLLAFLGP